MDRNFRASNGAGPLVTSLSSPGLFSCAIAAPPSSTKASTGAHGRKDRLKPTVLLSPRERPPIMSEDARAVAERSMMRTDRACRFERRRTLMQPKKLGRREFVKSAVGAGVALGVGGSAAPAGARVLGANDRINVGVIGVGGRGRYLLRWVMETGGQIEPPPPLLGRSAPEVKKPDPALA